MGPKRYSKNLAVVWAMGVILVASWALSIMGSGQDRPAQGITSQGKLQFATKRGIFIPPPRPIFLSAGAAVPTMAA